MLMKLFISILLIFAIYKFASPYLESSSAKGVTQRQALPMDVGYETIEAQSYLNSIRSK